MKLASCFALLAGAGTNAHYLFPRLIVNGAVLGSDWQYVRETANHYSNGPVTDVNDQAIRCYELDGRPAATTPTVSAGSTVGFVVTPSLTHMGPLQFYLAKVPSGQTAATWDGAGQVWFKIFGQGPIIKPDALEWPTITYGASQVTVKLPASLPSGDYLLRVEHIALHGAGTSGGAQFYIACSQLTVTNGGSGKPSPLVSFPGAYKATDPGILINIYWPVPTNYTLPGPAVWTG